MHAGAVTQRIKTHDVLNVGVSLGFVGLSFREINSLQWRGFDIDLARAVAIAILGNSKKLTLFHYSLAIAFKH
ncbi:type 2 periplasmic-binding domain-containing protein [Xenorhabdus doucetiae]|uniref:hypothetical protein n=1 Tax=Xenorhabdus doucetiae TaxID=351671 RepID=UPI002B402BF6|nr:MULTISPECIES: hypothetical protein [unclassified Xenorhabdus]